ncbi:MAG TPA: ScyD/ScyE family protein [Thermomicrobiales bacterium]|nr:ScyD/ScyE family protein [Thermomicrobiales bacterium]
MHRRPLPVVVGLALVFAMVLPVVALAQTGSVSSSLFSLSAPLSGGAEVPTGDPDGFGFARITILRDAGQLCFQTSVARIEPATASHIHAGAGGATGPVVIPLGTPDADGLVRGCVDADAALLTDILTNPWNYYVNVHNAAYPAGAIRGQLSMAGTQPPAPPAPPSWEMETIIEGLNNPRGVDVAADGALHVAEAGSGGDECHDIGTPEEPAEICLGMTGAVTTVADGVVERVGDSLPSLSDRTGTFSGGPHDTATDADGNVYVVTGLGATAADREGLGSDIVSMLGKLYMLAPDGSWSEVADLAAYEFENNTAGDFYVNEETGEIDPSAPNLESNPYSVVAVGDGVLVADAGANAVLHVSAGGTISPFAIFPPEMIESPEFLGLPPGTLIPMDAVPTAITVGPDGAVYVGQLTGFPFPVGDAKIWRLEDLNGDGDAIDEGEMTVYAEGLTAVVDIEFGPDGTLYAVEIARNGLLAAEEAQPDDVEAITGAVVAVAADGSLSEVVSTGLVLPGGVAVAADGSLYVTNGSVFPPGSEMSGSLVHVTHAE